MDKQELRIFVAHQKGDSDAALLEFVTGITLALRRSFATREPNVTLGRDDYSRHFARCGSWDRWSKDVATRIIPVSREPAYHGIVVPGMGPPAASSPLARVGAATQAIVAQALAIGKPVLLFHDGKLTKASRVVKVAERDFKNGWQVS